MAAVDWKATMAQLEERTIRAAAVDGYGALPDSIRRIRHGVSAIYRCETRDQGSCYLRFIHEDLIPRRTSQANAEFLEHTAAAGAPVPALVRPAAGGAVLAVLQGREPFLATAVREVPGRPLSRDDCAPGIFFEWGRAMALLHRAAETFEPSDPGAYLEEDAHWQATRALLRADDTLALGEWQAVDAWWSGTARAPGDWGLTHADMNATNAVWDGTRVHLVDFDEPIWHVFAADLARPFREMDHHPASAREAARAALFEGYRSERALSPEWEGALPWLVRMKQLEIYAYEAVRAGVGSSSPDTLLADGRYRRVFLAERRRDFERYARAR